ncbi:MAG: hypothetical protein M3O70_20310, partial [Actinomycetota bacterium]|nr:hypothetical protein [Actinomycetota bacterium]
MKRALLIALAVIVVAGAFGLVAVGGYLGNMFGGAEHPPCETLPSREQVRRALDQQTELTGK